MIENQTIQVNKIPISNNRFLRMHWTKRRADKQEWVQTFLPFLQIRDVLRGKKVELTICVHRKRAQDPDNAAASQKNIIDALKDLHFLVDDNDKWLVLNQPIQIVSRVEKTILFFRTIREFNVYG